LLYTASKVSVEEMDKNRVPIYLRDRCVHRVIPLNNCRHENLYAPWACEEERLRYERCQFKQFLKHVRKSERLWKKEEKLKLIQSQIAAARARAGPAVQVESTDFDGDDDESDE
jgi:NADH dehydrogenase (ubiquinone) 1 beta subcomplex subunit 7